MQIYGASQLHGAQTLRAPHSIRQEPISTGNTAPSASDELTLSDSARFVDQARDLPEIRSDRVAQIRAAIADGTYDNDAKLSVALDRLLNEIG